MTVLLIDDEEDIREALGQALELAGHRVHAFATANRVQEYIRRDFEGVIVSDIRMPGIDGMALLDIARQKDPDLPLILMSGHGDIPLAVEAMKIGAEDFLAKPFSTDQFVARIGRALEKRRLVLENRQLKSLVSPHLDMGERLIGSGRVMSRIRSQVRMLAGSDLPVLFQGETGTGKAFAAKLMHDMSERKAKPFVSICLASLPQDSLESELFGHVQGAFPGALRTRTGRLEHARGGTVFIDGIEGLPDIIQRKLVRLIDDNAFIPLGANEAVPLNARFMAATNIDLNQAVQNKEFRDDLYYRISGASLHLPSLSERREDIPKFFTTFLKESLNAQEAPRVDADFLMVLSQRDWPGNLRQLRHAAENYLIGITHDDTIPVTTLASVMADYEKSVIAASLRAHEGRIKDTYEALDISRKSLYEKMQKYGLSREDSK